MDRIADRVMELTFDPVEHAYTLDGERLPSVTQILVAAGLVELLGPASQIEYARERGTASHVATELDDLGDLDEATVVDEVWPYLRAWRAFRAETGFTPLHIEKRLHHPRLRYAGTIDRIGTLHGKPVILDVKTGASRRATGLQLAAYLEMAAGWDLVPKSAQRIAVHLAGDETYKVERYRNPRDVVAFMAAFTLHNWKNES